MYKEEMPYVSPQYTKDDLLSLCNEEGLSPNSNNYIFERAIAVFRDRIQGRFLDQIEALSDDIATNGFSIMALECLLIETLAQFREGLRHTRNCSKSKYTSFLVEIDSVFGNFPPLSGFATLNDYHDQVYPDNKPPQNNALIFYDRIRSGILHQAQTSDNSGLTENNQNGIIYWNNGYYMVSVPLFVESVNNYIDRYCDQLRSSENYILRGNFVNKLRYICRLNKITWNEYL